MSGLKNKTGLIEAAPGIRKGLADLPGHLNAETISAGLIAAIFGCTGPPLIIMNAAMAAGYTSVQTISWLCSVCVFGGLLSLVLALRYQQPITGAWSIPIAVMLSSTLPFFNINQAVGAYFLAGLMVLLLGVSGLVGKVMRLLPMPIVMGMIAGAMIKFGTGMILSIQSLPVADLPWQAILYAQNFPIGSHRCSGLCSLELQQPFLPIPLILQIPNTTLCFLRCLCPNFPWMPFYP